MICGFKVSFKDQSSEFEVGFGEDNQAFDASLGDVITVLPDTYTGDYTVIPKAYEEQVLPTEGKSMRDDVKVLEIPVYEVSNPYGTTINIGG